ncbi:MAG: hypothetical protein WAK17_24885 [Candidatus Nitrosopolaris sp.]
MLIPSDEILTAGSGKECIEQFIQQKRQENNIDLLLLDYRLKDRQWFVR